MYTKRASLFKDVTAWVTRYRSNLTAIMWAKGHIGARDNEGADRPVLEDTLKKHTEPEV